MKRRSVYVAEVDGDLSVFAYSERGGAAKHLRHAMDETDALKGRVVRFVEARRGDVLLTPAKLETTYRVEFDWGHQFRNSIRQWRWEHGGFAMLNEARRARRELRANGERAAIRIVRIMTEVVEEHEVTP